jgi:hypothetical protein
MSEDYNLEMNADNSFLGRGINHIDSGLLALHAKTALNPEAQGCLFSVDAVNLIITAA